MLLSDAGVEAAANLVAAARACIASRVISAGRVQPAVLEAEQVAAHGLAWMATYAEALRELAGWARRLASDGRLGETEQLILQIGFGEYLAQLVGGIPMSQNEIARPEAVGVGPEVLAAFRTPAVAAMIANGNSDAARARLVELLQDGHPPPPGSTKTTR